MRKQRKILTCAGHQQRGCSPQDTQTKKADDTRIKKPNLKKKTREGEHIHALPPAAGRLGETARSEPPAGRAASKDPDEGDMAAEGEPPAVCVDRAAVAAGFDGCA